MKKINKIVAGALAAALTLSLGGIFMGCNSGVNYTFEAEDAVTEGNGTGADQSQKPAEVEDNVVYNNGEESDVEVTGLGGFNSVGQKIIWTVVADADCEVTITLYAASAMMAFSEDFTGLGEINFDETDAYSFKVNGEEAKLSGTLPATSCGEQCAEANAPGLWWHVGTASCKAKLKAGENTIVFEIVGQASMMGSGVNVDKIVINSPVVLTEKKA